jgi:hypothetical protein
MAGQIPPRNAAARYRTLTLLLLPWIALLASPAQLHAEEPEFVYKRLTVSTGIDISTGDYGLEDDSGRELDTEMYFIPLSIRYERGPWLGKISLSILNIHGPGDPQAFGSGTDPGTLKDSGIGDINLDLTYFWAPDHEWLPIIEVGTRTKLPTASRSKGLGSGQVDFTLSLDLSRTFGDWTPYLHTAYRFLGDSADFTRSDGLGINLGVQYKLLEKLNVGISYDWRQSSLSCTIDPEDPLPCPPGSDPQEISPYMSYRVNDDLSITPYAAFGLNSSSLDFGGGLAISFYY